MIFDNDNQINIKDQQIQDLVITNSNQNITDEYFGRKYVQVHINQDQKSQKDIFKYEESNKQQLIQQKQQQQQQNQQMQNCQNQMQQQKNSMKYNSQQIQNKLKQQDKLKIQKNVNNQEQKRYSQQLDQYENNQLHTRFLIKQIVSKNKRRFSTKEFNLDLSYIKPNIIAMGFPSDKLESVYRNSIDDVKKFFQIYHNGHIKIYNLCSERKYNHKHFQNNVSEYPFDDHNPPDFNMIFDFCKDVHEYLQKHQKNTVAIHCKAGKGRTGTMICCYLLYAGYFKKADDALNYFAKNRTFDNKGVTIPSQIRYVQYFEKAINQETKIFSIQQPNVTITKIVLKTVPQFNIFGGCGKFYYSSSYFVVAFIIFQSSQIVNNHQNVDNHRNLTNKLIIFIIIMQLLIQTQYIKIKIFQLNYQIKYPIFVIKQKSRIYYSKLYHKVNFYDKENQIEFNNIYFQVQGDYQIIFYSFNQTLNTEKIMFSFWLNTLFYESVTTLNKNSLDRCVQDNKHKIYDESFKIQIYMDLDTKILDKIHTNQANFYYQNLTNQRNQYIQNNGDQHISDTDSLLDDDT